MSVVLVLAIASNFAMLVNGGDISRQKSQVTTGQLTAYRIAGDQVDPTYQPTPLDQPRASTSRRCALRLARLSRPSFLDASTLTRQSADKALVGSLGIHPQPTTKSGEQPAPPRAW